MNADEALECATKHPGDLNAAVTAALAMKEAAAAAEINAETARKETVSKQIVAVGGVGLLVSLQGSGISQADAGAVKSAFEAVAGGLNVLDVQVDEEACKAWVFLASQEGASICYAAATADESGWRHLTSGRPGAGHVPPGITVNGTRIVVERPPYVPPNAAAVAGSEAAAGGGASSSAEVDGSFQNPSEEKTGLKLLVACPGYSPESRRSPLPMGPGRAPGPAAG